VRPVVVQPVQSDSPQMRTLPRNAASMPVGVPANSVGLGDTYGQRLRRLLWVGIPLTVVIALACSAWLAVGNAKPLRTVTLNNGVYAYNFLFYKSTESVNLVGGSGLQADGKALVIAKQTTDNVVKDCGEVGKKWKNAFTVAVEGVDRPVCVLNDNVFLVTFYHGKVKHLFEVTYTSPHAISANDVRKIMESIKVAQE
jgi:hypothetical protein